MDRFDVDELDEDWPFEVDHQAGHLLKHPRLGLDDIGNVWAAEPLFYAATPPAHWLIVAEVAGKVLTVPLAPSNTGDPRRCRLTGCYVAPGTSPAATRSTMTPDEEHAFYADSNNQVPHGQPVRRKARLSEPVPVRFPEDLLREVRDHAAADDRSVSSWIRRAVEHELDRNRG